MRTRPDTQFCNLTAENSCGRIMSHIMENNRQMKLFSVDRYFHCIFLQGKIHHFKKIICQIKKKILAHEYKFYLLCIVLEIKKHKIHAKSICKNIIFKAQCIEFDTFKFLFVLFFFLIGAQCIEFDTLIKCANY